MALASPLSFPRRRESINANVEARGATLIVFWGSVVFMDFHAFGAALRVGLRCAALE
jgi:hypothetical protein